MLKTSIKQDFLDLFHHEVEDNVLHCNNSLNAFILKVQNNSFAYSDLIDLLGDSLHHFALSRATVGELVRSGKFNTLVSKAKEKLRRYSANEGELGEILLYCLLESHLNAPKILTKLELKTASNDYVKGADGVHLLKLNAKDHQIILGESKLNSSLKTGIYEAFSSIKKLLDDHQNKLRFEMDLVNSQIVKESFDGTTYELLKKILIPSAKDDLINLDYSFGIFLGYNIEISDEDKALPNPEFRSEIRSKIKKEIIGHIESINYQLKKHEFSGFDFYLYIIPFTFLQTHRKEFIKNITA